MRRRIVVVALLLALAVGQIGVCQASSLTQEQQLNAYYTLYTLAMNSASYDEALADIEKCFDFKDLANDALMSDLYLKRGYAKICLGDGDKTAMDDLNDCLALTPDTADALMLRMQLYVAEGKSEEAFADAETYLGYYPDQTAVFSTLGELLSAQGDNESAVRAFDRYIQDAKEPLPAAYQLRGQSYLQLAKYEEAVADLTVAVEGLSESGLRARYLRGIANMQTPDYAAAAEDLAVCSDVVKRFLAQAVGAQATPQPDAQPDAQATPQPDAEIAQLDADILNSPYYLGISLLQLARYDEAISEFNVCTEYGVNAEAALFWRASCELDSGDYASAIADFTSARDAGVEPEQSLYYLGVSNMGAGNLETAVELFSQCVEDEIMRDQALYNRGMCYLQLGDTEKSAADLQAVVGTAGTEAPAGTDSEIDIQLPDLRPADDAN